MQLSPSNDVRRMAAGEGNYVRRRRQIKASISRHLGTNCLLFTRGARAGGRTVSLRSTQQIPPSNYFAIALRVRAAKPEDHRAPPPIGVGLSQCSPSLARGGYSNGVSTSASWQDRPLQSFSDRADPGQTVLRSIHVLRGRVNRVSNQSIRRH